VSPRFASIALPVPLRRAFTYRVPEGLSLAPGMRVAVPFAGQRLAGFVLSLDEEAPAEVTRVRDVAGPLEPTPVFDAELLGFLTRAADYYLAPLGEVLKTAAPALPKNAMAALAEQGFLEPGGTLKGRAVATATTLRVSYVQGAPDALRLGARQRTALALLASRQSLLLPELATLVPSARAVVKTLAAHGLVSLETVEVPRDRFFASTVERDAPRVPTAEQAHAIATLHDALAADKPGAYLLHGVTGSGKTEVYLQLVARALAEGKGALVLVPEIALTPQLVARFRARFGEDIAVLHSGLGERERDASWRALWRGEVRLAIGARSALFAPVPRLAVIIVDEEHDPSFKQEEGFRYHGRDMALLRAHLAGALCVLGSATPSLETFYLSEAGRMKRLTLQNRPTANTLPEVEVVDLARHRGPGPSGHPLLTGPLHRALERTFGRGEQAIIFLNRRGFAPTLVCSACTEPLRCPACSVSLTEHRRAGLFRCHYCDFSTGVSEACPACGKLALERVGIGTERIEDALSSAFPGVRVGRLDRDTAASGGVDEVLARMRDKSLDVLVGTQMVTKGHDLPGVTLVGVLLADQGLMFPDFRAAERTFQLLAQVSGRAGRGDLPGRVVLQTYQPAHHSVRYALAHDYLGFYREELGQRRELGYTPFARLVAVRADAADEAVARTVIDTLAAVARGTSAVSSGAVSVLGPTAAPIARIRARYRMRFFLRGRSREALRAAASAVVEAIERGVKPARAHVDVDPVSML
jgi:primosomal protein N' (replication factor Y) (superfamily II helicase)